MTSTAFRQSSKLRSRGKSILVFNGTITGTPALATGSGTENDPYQISTAEGLKWFRDKVNNAKTKEETKICAVLTANIDLKMRNGRRLALEMERKIMVPLLISPTLAHLTATAIPSPV